MKTEYLYVVYRGTKPGIYATWEECKESIKGFEEPVYRKFSTIAEVKAFWFYGNTSSCCVDDNLITNFGKIKIEAKEAEDDNDPSPSDKIKKEDREAEDGSNDLSSVSDKETESETDDGDQLENKTTVVYAEGSCPFNGTVLAKGGFGVFWGPKDSRNTSKRLPGRIQTNMRAWVQAVLYALEQDKDGVDTLEIRTSCIYVISAVTDWYKRWVNNGWLTVYGQPVKHRDLFERILALMASRKGRVIYTHVSRGPAHEGLEKATRLADIGAGMAGRF